MKIWRVVRLEGWAGCGKRTHQEESVAWHRTVESALAHAAALRTTEVPRHYGGKLCFTVEEIEEGPCDSL